jgi:hypothetical protein
VSDEPIRLHLLTAWQSFPYEPWYDYIRPMVCEEERAAIDAHLPWPAHDLYVLVSAIGWLAIRCEACGETLWERVPDAVAE